MSKLSEDFKENARGFASAVLILTGMETSIGCAFAIAAAAAAPVAPLVALGLLGGLLVGGPLIMGAGLKIGDRPRR